MTLNEWAYSANRPVLRVNARDVFVSQVSKLNYTLLTQLKGLSDYAIESVRDDVAYLAERSIER